MARPTPAVLTAWLAKSEARDKIGRTAQYGCRCLLGILSEMIKTDPSKKELHGKVQSLMSALASARRTGRWGKELDSIPASLKALSAGDLIGAASKAALTCFFLHDRVAWFRQTKLFKGEAKPMIQRALSFLTLSWAINLYTQLMEYRKLKSAMTNSQENAKAAQKKVVAAMFKSVLLVVQGMHVSGLFEHHDALAGACGVYTSWSDAMAQYPLKEAK